MGKKVFLANCNITFGDENFPMLEYFNEVIYPALKSENEIKQSGIPYRFHDVELKQNEDGDFIMVGELVKITHVEIKSDLVDGKLISKNETHGSAPYSRFILFLKNHRMLLIKNEALSPTLLNFKNHLSRLATNIINEYNNQSTIPIPDIEVDVIGLSNSKDVNILLEKVKKIKYLKLRLFPLNGDIDFSEIQGDLRVVMESLGSKTGNVQFNSPSSKQNVAEIIGQTSGLSDCTLKVIKEDDTEETFGNDRLTTTLNYDNDGGNIVENDDNKLC